ncbi:hypothetical protein DES37_10821 [Mangrovibacter plantisponsor]|uniref:Uncharacterized protein n=1 Tax=Mangrovibacter plantisponsor TaxID=451513 RepID=A0A317PZ62_9ENTR|nr:hypothetical protein DES37_10821 [Mangrovibacter plantisponsor]
MFFNSHEIEIINLIDVFITGRITAPEFEHKYLYRDSSKKKRAERYVAKIVCTLVL